MGTVLGMSQVLANLAAAKGNIKQQVGDAVQNAGLVTEGVAKKNTKVKTGRLRAGNRYQKTGPTSCKVGNDVEYAAPVELGHRTHSGTTVLPSPFLFPGYLAGKKALQEDLAKVPGLKIISWS